MTEFPWINDEITANWKLPLDFLFDEANVPGPNPEEWPLDLLTALSELSNLTSPDEDAPNEDLRLQKFHCARDGLVELCTARAEALRAPGSVAAMEAAIMTADDVKAVIEKMKKDKVAAADAQKGGSSWKQAKRLKDSLIVDNLLLTKELSGQEEIQRDREMSVAAGIPDSDARSSSSSRPRTEPKPTKALQPRPSAQPSTRPAIPRSMGPIIQPIKCLTELKPNMGVPEEFLGHLIASFQPPTVSTASGTPSRLTANTHAAVPITSRDTFKPATQCNQSIYPTSSTTTPGATLSQPPTVPASAAQTTSRDRVLRARALRNLQHELEAAELKVQRTGHLLDAKSLKCRIWDIEDEIEDKPEEPEGEAARKRKRVRFE